MSKLIRCPKCGRKPDVEKVMFDNVLVGIWCRDCGSVSMEIKLDPPKTPYVEQERRKVEQRKKKKRAVKFDRSLGVQLTDLPLAIRKKLGYPD